MTGKSRARRSVFGGTVILIFFLAGGWLAQPHYNAQANKALLAAVAANDAAGVRSALTQGADPNVRSGKGYALRDLLPLCLRATSPFNLSDAQTARRELTWRPPTVLCQAALVAELHGAASPDTTAAALLAGGADPNLPSFYGETPLHRVATVQWGWRTNGSGSPEEAAGMALVPRLLIEKGANPNAPDAEGRTPLMVAIYSGAPASVVKLLLDKGADPDLKMNTGACARDFVNAGTDPEVAKLLAPPPQTAAVSAP